jgi:hypothetical protein
MLRSADDKVLILRKRDKAERKRRIQKMPGPFFTMQKIQPQNIRYQTPDAVA